MHNYCTQFSLISSAKLFSFFLLSFWQGGTRKFAKIPKENGSQKHENCYSIKHYNVVSDDGSEMMIRGGVGGVIQEIRSAQLNLKTNSSFATPNKKLKKRKFHLFKIISKIENRKCYGILQTI